MTGGCHQQQWSQTDVMQSRLLMCTNVIMLMYRMENRWKKNTWERDLLTLYSKDVCYKECGGWRGGVGYTIFPKHCLRCFHYFNTKCYPLFPLLPFFALFPLFPLFLCRAEVKHEYPWNADAGNAYKKSLSIVGTWSVVHTFADTDTSIFAFSLFVSTLWSSLQMSIPLTTIRSFYQSFCMLLEPCLSWECSKFV